MALGQQNTALGRALVVGLGYGLLAFAALSITRFDAQVESIWISNALLVWGLVVSRPSAWPLLIGCAALGHVGAHLAVGDALNLTLAFLVGDMSECAFAAWLLRLRLGALAFQSRGATFYFLFVCGLAAPFVSALIASGASWIATGQALSQREMIVWFAVDALGLVLFLPLVHTFAAGRWRMLRGKFVRVFIAASLVAGIGVMSVLSGMPLLRLLVLPLFVIVCFELGVAALQISMAVAFLTWIGLVLSGNAPALFGAVTDERDALLLVQVLMAVFTASFLPLAVVIEEKQRLNDTLSETIKETQEAWGAIIGAEARYRLVVDNVSETVMRIRVGGEILFASPACTALLHAERNFEGRNIGDLLHPEDRDFVVDRVRQSVAAGLFNLPQRWRLRIHGDDDKWYAIDARVTPVLIGAREHEFVVVFRPEQDANLPPILEPELSPERQSIE